METVQTAIVSALIVVILLTQGPEPPPDAQGDDQGQQDPHRGDAYYPPDHFVILTEKRPKNLSGCRFCTNPHHATALTRPASARA